MENQNKDPGRSASVNAVFSLWRFVGISLSSEDPSDGGR